MHGFLGGARPYLLLTVLVLVVGLPGLASAPPGAAEAAFIAATRAMSAAGDFVLVPDALGVPTVAPVGVHWLQAAATALVPAPAEGLLAHRLPSLLGGLAAVLLTFHFGRALLGPGPALLGAALLATGWLTVLALHRATPDAVVLACVVAAQGALGRFYMQPRGGAKVGLGTAFIFWMAQGCGALAAGGLVPAVSLLTAAALCLADRATMWLRGLRPLPGLLLAAAIAAPWLAAAAGASDPGALWSLVLRPLPSAAAPAAPGAHALLTVALLWPASLFAVPGLARALRFRHAAAVRYVLAWAVLPWLVLEALPGLRGAAAPVVLPPLALLAALVAVGGHDSLRAAPARAYGLLWAAASVAVAAAVAVALAPVTAWAVPTAAALVLAAAAPAWLAWRENFLAAGAAAVAAAALAWAAVFAALLPATGATAPLLRLG